MIINKQYPNPELTKDCTVPVLRGKTIGAKLIREKELEASLKDCNADKAALRAWTKDESSSDEQADNRIAK